MECADDDDTGWLEGCDAMMPRENEWKKERRSNQEKVGSRR